MIQCKKPLFERLFALYHGNFIWLCSTLINGSYDQQKKRQVILPTALQNI